MSYLHIVSFDIPYPANYGGVIDVYYKIKALHKAGVKVILHCFVYGGKQPQPELNQVCYQVHYYQRKQWYLGFKPYIVGSRNSKQLLQNLADNNYPILFEGLHACYFLNHPSLQHKKRFVRTHNIEHDYYLHLMQAEQSVIKKAYFAIETTLLKRFEPILANATGVFSLSANDTAHFKSINTNTHYLPVFNGCKQAANAAESKEKYCLYHGKLSVAENAKAADFLINEVFSKTQIPLIIAGDEAPLTIKKMAAKYQNIKLITAISSLQMQQLIQQAQVHVLPTFQATGIKLKLLHALYSGQHVVVNSTMVKGNELGQICTICNTPQQWLEAIHALYNQPIQAQTLQQRFNLLNAVFNDDVNAGQLINWMGLTSDKV